MRSESEIRVYPLTLCDDLVRRATLQPQATFLAKRNGAGWTTIDSGAALLRVRTIGAGVLQSTATASAPLAIVAENSIGNARRLTRTGSTTIGYHSAARNGQRLSVKL